MGYGDSADEGERLKGVAGMEGTVLCWRCIVEDGRGIGILCVAEGREAVGRATIDAVGEDDEETVGGTRWYTGCEKGSAAPIKLSTCKPS